MNRSQMIKRSPVEFKGNIMHDSKTIQSSSPYFSIEEVARESANEDSEELSNNEVLRSEINKTKEDLKAKENDLLEKNERVEYMNETISKALADNETLKRQLGNLIMIKVTEQEGKEMYQELVFFYNHQRKY